MNRSELAAQVETVGTAINAARTALFAANCIFLTGAMRAAEEVVMFIYTTLQDTTIPETEL